MDTITVILLFLLSFDNRVQILNAELFFQQRSKICIFNSPHKVIPNDQASEDHVRPAFILRMQKENVLSLLQSLMGCFGDTQTSWELIKTNLCFNESVKTVPYCNKPRTLMSLTWVCVWKGWAGFLQDDLSPPGSSALLFVISPPLQGTWFGRPLVTIYFYGILMQHHQEWLGGKGVSWK